MLHGERKKNIRDQHLAGVPMLNTAFVVVTWTHMLKLKKLLCECVVFGFGKGELEMTSGSEMRGYNGRGSGERSEGVEVQ